MTENELHELIRLKRYEQPEEGYFDDFLTEFQERQRSEMLKTSARGLLVERVKAWFDFSSGSNRFVVGTGMACAACAVVAMTMHFLPKLERRQQMAQQMDKLPTDVAETSPEELRLMVKDSTQVSSELVREQLSPIDFSKPESTRELPFSSDYNIF